MLGKILKGRYQVTQILNSSGFCHTYLGQDIALSHQPPCVIKQLLPVHYHSNSLPSLRRLFNREAAALEKLSHYPQVPQLLAYFEEEEQFYLVQEFIAGQPLNIELQPGRRWRERQVVELLQEVLSILEVVHAHGLIHRDLKPSNMIRRQSDSRLVLIDFGSVKQAWTQVVTRQGQTNANFAVGIPATIAVGTPGYMPTEQGRGRPRPNSDIYALGMIAIQALTGLQPTLLLEDAETGEIIWQNYASVSPELVAVLNQMVRYHFRDRYQSVTEVIQALQPLINRYLLSQTDTLRLQPALTATSTRSALSSQLKTIPVKDQRPSGAVADQTNKTANPNLIVNLPLLLGLVTGVVSALALILVSYYSLRPLRPQASVPQSVTTNTSSRLLSAVAQEQTLSGHSEAVWSVAVTPDGQTLVSASGDKTIKLWDLSTGEQRRTLAGNAAIVLSVALTPDGQNLASGSYAAEKAIKIWHLPTGELRPLYFGRSNNVWSVAISPNGQNLASSNGDGSIKLWHLPDGDLYRTLTGHLDTVWSVAISPDGQTLASGSKDRTVKVWYLPTGELRRTLFGHTDRVRSVAISPDGQNLVSSSWDKTIKIWHLQTGELLRTLSGHLGSINSVAISADGQIVASGSDDRTIKLWHLATGKLIRTISGHQGNVNSVTFAQNDKILVSGSGDKTVRIWRL